MPSPLLELAERGELENSESVQLGHYRIGRGSRGSAVGNLRISNRYWINGPRGHLWFDGTWRDVAANYSIRSREDMGGWYDSLAEAIDHLYAALIAAGEV